MPIVEIAELILEYLKVLIWPGVVVFTLLLFKKQLHQVVLKLQKASLPGGISFDFNQEVKEVKQLQERVEISPPPEEAKGLPRIPKTEANERLAELGLQLSPSGLDMNRYREIAQSDPNLALAGLRIDFEVLTRNLARGFNIVVGPRESGLRLLRKLYEENALTGEQLLLAQKIYQLSSSAVHGQEVSQAQANQIIDAAEVLAEQYISWLSWGFNDDWQPSEQAF